MYCVQYQGKNNKHHEHDSSPPICIHLGDVRWVYVKLEQLRDTYSMKAETFANVTTSACLTYVGDDNSVIYEQHGRLQILHWTHTDAMVQYSFHASVREFQIRCNITTVTYHPSKHVTCHVMDGTCMYKCPTFCLFWKCLADMSY